MIKFNNLSYEKKEYIGLAGLLLTTIFWGFGFIFVSTAVNAVRPPYIVGMRMLIASIILFFIFMPKILKTTKQDFIYSIPTGVALFLGFTFQTYAAENMIVSKVAFFTGSNVVMVPFLAFLLFKHKLRIKSFICAALAICGIAVFSLNSDFSIELYDMFGIVCAFFFALHIALVAEFSKKTNVLVFTFWQLLFTSILAFLFGFIIGEPISVEQFSGDIIFSIAYLGVFSTFVCYCLQNVCQKYTTASKASLVLSLEALTGASLGIILLGESISIRLVFGAILIFSAIIISEVNFKFGKREAKI